MMSKLIYYLLLGASFVLLLFLIAGVLKSIVNGIKPSEGIILLTGAVINSIFIWLSFRYGVSQSSHWVGALILAGGMITALIAVFIGMLNFNGPVRWNQLIKQFISIEFLQFIQS